MQFNWLHLTDFHQGQGDQDWLWPTMQDEFYRDLEKLQKLCGPWDLILFTGDMVNRGTKAEFKAFDLELDRLMARIAKLQGGKKPLFVAVPGNHDLARPPKRNAAVKGLEKWADDREVREEFWKDPKGEYRAVINQAFAEHQTWWGRHAKALSPYKAGELPGDFSFTFEKDGTKLGVLGLNSSFLHLSDVEKDSLALHPKQFHAACGGNGPEWVKRHHACLLMTHHPPSWLNDESREDLDEHITRRGSFALHLFGHAHEPKLQVVSGGGDARRMFQGRSLFGLEYLGDRKERSHGYAAGRIECDSSNNRQGILTLWPRMAQRQGIDLSIAVDLPAGASEDSKAFRPQIFPLGQSCPEIKRSRFARITLDVGLDELSAPQLRDAVAALQRLGRSVELRVIQAGSAMLFVEGDPAELTAILHQFETGGLSQLAGIAVRNAESVDALPDGAPPRGKPIDRLLNDAQAANQPLESDEQQDWSMERLTSEGVLDELAEVFDQEPAAHALLEQVGFPRRHLPGFGTSSPMQFWRDVSREILNGRMVGGIPALLRGAADEYPGNRVFRRWRETRSEPLHRNVEPPEETDPAEPAEPRVEETNRTWDILIHGDARVHDVMDRVHELVNPIAGARVDLNYAMHGLIGVHLTGLDMEQASGIRDSLQEEAAEQQAQVQLASPRFRDYLYSQLTMRGPDNSVFALENVPASTRVKDIARAGISQYEDEVWPRDDSGLQRPAVVDHEREDGSTQRLDPDNTLHESGVEDGDSLHVAPQSTAGSVNPIEREQGLIRVRQQVKEYVDGHADFHARTNALNVPTNYTFEFTAPGFAPPSAPGGPPLFQDKHRVRLRLLANFPMQAPEVLWQTPIFHPNVHAESGRVCLGVLQESYRPAMHFGELCHMLMDMASYQNYEVRGVYNTEAARWATSPEGMAAIEARGGRNLIHMLATVFEQQEIKPPAHLRIKRVDS